MDKAVLFWILVGSLGFAFALAVQMRVIVALVLRRALKAWREDLSDRVKANSAVVSAAGDQPLPEGSEPWLQDATAHLKETYPNPLRHLRTARRYSVIMPILLFGVLCLGRFVWGVI